MRFHKICNLRNIDLSYILFEQCKIPRITITIPLNDIGGIDLHSLDTRNWPGANWKASLMKHIVKYKTRVLYTTINHHLPVKYTCMFSRSGYK